MFEPGDLVIIEQYSIVTRCGSEERGYATEEALGIIVQERYYRLTEDGDEQCVVFISTKHACYLVPTRNVQVIIDARSV